MRPISIWVIHTALAIALLGASAAIALPLVILLQGLIETHAAIRITLSILALAWLVCIWMFAERVADLVANDDQSFMEAFRLVLLEARLTLRFVPFLGRRSAPPSKELDGGSNTPIE
jgi:hypothetical protein